MAVRHKIHRIYMSTSKSNCLHQVRDKDLAGWLVGWLVGFFV